MTGVRDGQLKGTAYELFMFLLSILAVANLVLLLSPLGENAKEVVLVVDIAMTPIFMFDFGYRLLTARSRREYLVDQLGWTDALAALPLLHLFRVFRVFRVIRLTRHVGARTILIGLERSRALSVFLITIWLVIVTLEVVGAAEYYAERGAPGASITTGGDALWWGLVTITTVGYGDEVPVTPLGRVIGTVLLAGGLVLFSVLTGFIAQAFITPHLLHDEPPAGSDDDVAELRRLLADQEAGMARIRATVDAIERRLAERAALTSGPVPHAASGGASRVSQG